MCASGPFSSLFFHAMTLAEFFPNSKRRLRGHREPCKARSDDSIERWDSFANRRVHVAGETKRSAFRSSRAKDACRQVSTIGPSLED